MHFVRDYTGYGRRTNKLALPDSRNSLSKVGRGAGLFGARFQAALPFLFSPSIPHAPDISHLSSFQTTEDRILRRFRSTVITFLKRLRLGYVIGDRLESDK